MKLKVEVNDDVVKWFHKKSDSLGLDIDDLIEFIMKGYMAKNDPKKAVALNNRNRIAAGMSAERAKRYVSLPIEKLLWEEICKIAKNRDKEPGEMVLALIDDFAKNEE